MADEVIDQAYLDWLLNEPIYPNNPSYDEDLLSDQGKWMTQASKGGNLTTDLDFLISNNLLDYGAYDPLTSYEPVDAPGLRRLTQWSQGSPYQQYVAEWFRGGRSANELLTDLQSMVAQPSGDEFETAILQSMPKGQFYDQASRQYVMTDAPDMSAVGEELRSFENDVLSDPQYTIGPDGQPMSATTEDSPARQALLEAGYTTTPGETYDPYSFAPEGVTPEGDEAIRQAYIRSIGDLTAKNVALPLQTRRRDDAADMYQRFLASQKPEATPQGAVTPPTVQAPSVGAPAVNRNAVGFQPQQGGMGAPAVNRNAVGFTPPTGGAPTSPAVNRNTMGFVPQQSPRPATGGGFIGDVLTAAMRKRAGVEQGKTLQAKIAANEAQVAKTRASDASFEARRQNALRQALAEQLMRQGRSPFDDERNRRNAAVYGMGM